MGHLSHHKSYRDLQSRLDKLPAGFPDTELGREILQILFTPEEAALVARMPLVPRSARFIARRVGRDPAGVTRLLEQMADRGLIFDLYNPNKQRSYYMVSPPVVGFVEFSLMRRRQDLDQKLLAEKYHQLMENGGGFLENLMGGQTSIGRTLVHEQALSPDDVAELLTHDRATEAIRGARAIAVSLCYCRHKAEHLGQPCEHPMENCLSLNTGADFVIRRGLGRRIEAGEGLQLLDQARERGLVHIGDNVKRRLTYVCNCCSCCCGQLTAINRHGISSAVKTSPFMAVIDPHKCTGCGRCARRCPVQGVQINTLPPHVKRKARMYSKVDESICLGCGVCQPACRKGALRLEPRRERTLTPEFSMARILTMALERGKLQHQLFDDEEGPGFLVLNRLAGAVLQMPPVKQALMQEQLKSRFIGYLCNRARRRVRTASRA